MAIRQHRLETITHLRDDVKKCFSTLISDASREEFVCTVMCFMTYGGLLEESGLQIALLCAA